MKNYCGVDLQRCRSLETSTYPTVRLGFSLTCALHLDLLLTFFNYLLEVLTFM